MACKRYQFDSEMTVRRMTPFARNVLGETSFGTDTIRTHFGYQDIPFSTKAHNGVRLLNVATSTA